MFWPFAGPAIEPVRQGQGGVYGQFYGQCLGLHQIFVKRGGTVYGHVTKLDCEDYRPYRACLLWAHGGPLLLLKPKRRAFQGQV